MDGVREHGFGLDPGVSFLQKPITPDALLRRIREQQQQPVLVGHRVTSSAQTGAQRVAHLARPALLKSGSILPLRPRYTPEE